MARRTVHIVGVSFVLFAFSMFLAFGSPGAVAAATAPAAQTGFPWPWVITRAMGIASYLLLVVLTITGMLQTTGVLYRIVSPATSWSIHRAIASVLLVSVLLHVGALLFDHFIGLHVVEVLVPFASHYRPVLVALGIFGFYLLLLVLATSLYTLTSHPRFWRTVHVLAFPMFLLIFLHAVLLGTDSKTPWMIWTYWTTGVLVGLGIAYRLLWKYRHPSVSLRQLPQNRRRPKESALSGGNLS